MAWEPEDGRCQRCGAPLETEYEQDAGLCSLCQHCEEEQDEEPDEDGPINDFYNANGYF